jgi:4-oxalocrotonate tautomerase family enzyme
MPVVTIETWPMDKEKKKEVIKRITEVFTSQGIPGEAVTIIIHDTPLDSWGSGGEQHSEKFKERIRK